MTDIVERLRVLADAGFDPVYPSIMQEAADEIDRLRSTELTMAAKLIELRKVNAGLTSLRRKLNQMRAERNQ